MHANNKVFPQEYSDQELISLIKINSENLKKNLMWSATGVASPIHFTSKIDLCYLELQKRYNERFLQQVNRLNDGNEKAGRITFRLNIITIALAVASLILSVVTLLG